MSSIDWLPYCNFQLTYFKKISLFTVSLKRRWDRAFWQLDFHFVLFFSKHHKTNLYVKITILLNTVSFKFIPHLSVHHFTENAEEVMIFVNWVFVSFSLNFTTSRTYTWKITTMLNTLSPKHNQRDGSKQSKVRLLCSSFCWERRWSLGNMNCIFLSSKHQYRTQCWYLNLILKIKQQNITKNFTKF